MINTITVSKLISYLKVKLDGDQNLTRVLVSGEISNFHRQSTSGHCYFVLKDEKSQINCVMFKSSAIKLSFEPKNGDKVIINGSCSIFESSGQLQLYVSSIKMDGLGDLYLKYEELKKKLLDQGYFDESHKKTFNIKYPNNVCVLVGEKSAAMSDIKTCFKRRWPLTNVDYYPVLVQGDSAPESIIETLNYVDNKSYDYIILARGGGSFEDLYCFNDEGLVKCIYNLNTLVVTGIGHEQDYTLVDFVSDLRAPTPTASVELTTPNISDVITYIDSLNLELLDNLNSKHKNISMRLDFTYQRLINHKNNLSKYELKISELRQNINHIFLTKLNNKMNYIDYQKLLLEHSIKDKLKDLNILVKRYSVLLEAYSQDNILRKGYNYITKDKIIIKNLKQISLNDEIDINTYEGKIKANVKEILWHKKSLNQN